MNLPWLTDDEPEDGADHYIIIQGFHSPHLFGQLAELGLNTFSIICLNSQDYSVFQPKEGDELVEKDEKTLGKLVHHWSCVCA